MMTMAARRTASSAPVRSVPRQRGRRSSTGSTSSLHTMLLSATLSTTTIDIAADSPPMKASSDSQRAPAASGRVSTTMSGSAPRGSTSSPANAIGSTNRLMANRYSGKPHNAAGRWRSSRFSTTSIWNCRGRQIAAAIDTSTSPVHSPPDICSPVSQVACGSSAVRANSSGKPSNSTSPANNPTAAKQASLTTDSSAIAATMPRWCSSGSMRAAPNSTAKAAISTAAPNATAASVARPASGASITSRLAETAFNCNAMYGTEPTTAISVTSPASRPDLP